MDYVLTLVAPDGAAGVLDEPILAELGAALNTQGAHSGETDWLSHRRACDVAFGDLDPKRCEDIARGVLGERPVDLYAASTNERRKRLLIADMDSTIVTSETLDEIAAHAGIKDEIAAISARSMLGEINFEDSLRERIAMLKGLSTEALRMTLEATHLSTGARTFVRTMAAHGAYTALVSGGFTYFTATIRKACGFHHDAANELEVIDGALSGRVGEPILGPTAKRAALDTLCAQQGIGPHDALTIGDGANDQDMIRAAGLGIAYYGKPILAANARACIDHTDLRTALYFQGYRDSEFIED